MQDHPLERAAWVEIDTKALRANMKEIRERVGYDRQVCAVVKADAYGHGAVEVAKLELQSGANRLAVATVDEGVKLRKAGIKAPILMLAEPPISAIPLLLEYDITPTVTTIDFALSLGEMADAAGRCHPFHLKVNTGMNRIGVLDSEVVEFLKAISFHRGLELQGTFTHFATADESETWDFKKQLDRFRKVIESMRQADFDPGIVHCANSACIVRYPETYFDMVRPGIILYGLHPSKVTYGAIDLQPAMSVQCEVTHVKTPARGEGVSYGLKYRSPSGVQVATLPIGYADGLRRSLSGWMMVLHEGQRLPQVGTICMDQCMIEVDPLRDVRKHIKPVHIGDRVTIVGCNGGDELTLDMMANAAGTINYELACAFGMRMPKVYI